MKKDTFFSHRTWLAVSGLISAVQLLGIKPSQAKILTAKTPLLATEEISAIEAASCCAA